MHTNMKKKLMTKITYENKMKISEKTLKHDCAMG